MPRPKGFDEEAAIDAAMRAFWANGYDNTSTDDLCAATGLNRSSVYNAFRSKHDLFLRALHRYIERAAARQAAVLDGPGPVRERLRTLVLDAVEDECGDRLGCLVVNSAIELSARDPEVAEVLRADYERRVARMRAAIAEEPGLHPDVAHFVAASISGLRVAARFSQDPDALRAIARQALTAI